MLARNSLSLDFSAVADPTLVFQLIVEGILRHAFKLVLVKLLKMHLKHLHNVVREVPDMGDASEAILIIPHQSIGDILAQFLLS